MKKLNSKGFTLIELLAVIVILGILMIVAIPMVTKYINNSRKDAFADSALSYINAARYSLLNDEYNIPLPDDGNSVCIPIMSNYSKDGINLIEVEKATRSSYGGTWESESYVRAENKGGKVIYSIGLWDNKNYGTDGEVLESTLSNNFTKRSSIQQGAGRKKSTCSCKYGDDKCTVEEKFS